MEPFITLSAQPGAGARELGRAIVGELAGRGDHDWRVLDEEIAREAAADRRLNVALDELLREEFRNELEDFFAQFIGSTAQSEILDRVFDVVRRQARAGKAVIIGRAGVCVTRGLQLGLHLRLVASRKSRIERLIRLGVPDKAAQEELDKRERWRAMLMKRYFLRSVDDPLLYDAVLNADKNPMSELARIAADMLYAKVVRQRERGTILT